MEAFEGFQDKEFDLLNEAILKAIVASPDVGSVLQGFKSRDLINEMAVVNLILSLEELSDLMFSETTKKSTQTIDSCIENHLTNKLKESNQLTDITEKETSDKSNNHYLVDGKLLNRNEILFEKHCQEKFDEKVWLKRAKIKI